MTIACIWWDQSDGLRRITAIADSRAAVENNENEWVPLTELTIKLFSIQLRCHDLDAGLDPQRGGAWTNPYHVTEVGIAFAGYCFEALSIIAIVQKCLGSLVTEGSAFTPYPEKIFNFVSAIADRYLKTHTNPDRQSVQFLVFGFSPNTSSPWLGELRYRKGVKVRNSFHSDFGGEGELFCIGDADICHEIEGGRILRDIRKHAASLSEGSGSDAKFEYELEKARMDNAERKSIEEMVINKIKSKHAKTVGGSIQKLELYPADGGGAVSAYTEDLNFELSNGLPSLNDEGLHYVSVNQRMGRLPVVS
jgi:hypothetical protein